MSHDHLPGVIPPQTRRGPAQLHTAAAMVDVIIFELQCGSRCADARVTPWQGARVVRCR